ncbi:MAG: hypothetical protein PVH92_10525 [Anaerolineales bacterium]|jgi:hypothetical protein
MRRPCAIALLVCLLSGCSTLLRRPEQGIEVNERVEICFQQDEEGHILAIAKPLDCFSMRCTRPYLRSGTAVLDETGSRLDFELTFRLSESKNLLFGCGPDCAGGGTMTFDLGQVPVGLYRVYLWGTYQGELSVTSGLPWHDQCLP